MTEGETETIYFAAGCFWGVQSYFDQVPGVIATEVGYMGGHTDYPTYEEVCSHTTGHAETTKVEYNPSVIDTQSLIQQFYYMHDPTQLNRQGPDIGDSYRSAIFYTTKAQYDTALHVTQALNDQKYNGKIVTEITKAAEWWPAESYHQKYTEKTGRGMCHMPYRAL